NHAREGYFSALIAQYNCGIVHTIRVRSNMRTRTCAGYTVTKIPNKGVYMLRPNDIKRQGTITIIYNSNTIGYRIRVKRYSYRIAGKATISILHLYPEGAPSGSIQPLVQVTVVPDIDRIFGMLAGIKG